MSNRNIFVAISLCTVLIILLTSLSGFAAGREGVVGKSHPFDEGHEKSTMPMTECASCHTCENPTEENVCLNDCPRFEGHFTSAMGVDDGPDVIILEQLADLYKPVLFAHKLHAEMSEMTGGCINCHHYSEDTGSIPACKECHEIEPSAASMDQPSLKGAYHRQCINCHRDWSHENACGFCHERVDGTAMAALPDTTDIMGIPHPLIEAPKSYYYETGSEEGNLVTFHHEDHVQKFGQECVDCHRGDSCNSCHNTEKEVPQRLDHVTTCCACHGERDCAFCHSDHKKPDFDHGLSTGWSLKPFHTELDCNSCHGDPQSFKHPEATCTTCHIHWEVGSFDHAVTRVILDENHVDEDCDSCHIDMDFTVTPSCDDCHDEKTWDPKTGFEEQ